MGNGRRYRAESFRLDASPTNPIAFTHASAYSSTDTNPESNAFSHTDVYTYTNSYPDSVQP